MTLVMTPTDDFEAKQQKQEADLLQSYVENLSAEEKQSIYEQSKFSIFKMIYIV